MRVITSHHLQHLSSPPLLQRLYMRGRLDAIPHWIPSLPSLVRLSLKWSRLKDDPLISLRHIPNLVQLELCQVFVGDRLCFKADGFRKLKILTLDKFDELKRIDVEMGAMDCLEKLSIQRCKLLEKVPSGIGHLVHLHGLANLVHLELLKAYDGESLHFDAGGFPSLKLLVIDISEELQSVTIEEGAIPCLEKLIIQRCKLLKKVPSGIEHLANLKLLESIDMPDELMMALHPDGGEDHWKVSHVPEISYF